MEPDAALLRRYAETRDQEAFAELVRRHLDGVYSSALRRLSGDTHLAEDVAQKVFVELAQQAHSVARHPAVAGWLYTTTRNHAANTVRTEQRRRVREESVQVMNDPLSYGESNEAWQRVAPVLDWAIDRLSESDRTAVLLRFVDRKSFSQIGTALRVSDDAARMRVDRALEKLRALLAHRGVLSSAAALGLELSAHAVVAAPASVASDIAAAALASGATGLGPLSALFQLMTTSKIIGGAAAAALVLVAAGVVAHDLPLRQQAEGRLEAANSAHRVSSAKLQETEARLQSVNTEIARLTEKQSQEAARLQEEGTREKHPPIWDPEAEGKAFAERHPEVKKAMIEWRKTRAKFQWGALYRALAFTPAQIEEFEKVNGNGYFGRNLDSSANRYVRIPTGEAIAPEEYMRRLKEVLGDTGQIKYREVLEQQSARALVTQTASALIFTDNPLSTEQSNGLIALLTSYKHTSQTKGPASFDWDQVMNEAKSLLSTPQLATLEGMRAQDELQQAFNAAAKPVNVSGSKVSAAVSKSSSK